MDEEPREEQSAFEQFEAQLMEEFREKMEAEEEEKKAAAGQEAEEIKSQLVTVAPGDNVID